MLYAIVRNGRVENIIVWNGKDRYDIPEGCELARAREQCAIGGTYADGKFDPAPTENPIKQKPSRIGLLEERIGALEALRQGVRSR